MMNPIQLRQMLQYNQVQNNPRNNVDTSNYDGLGRLQFPNNDLYEGQFKKGKMEGKGKLTTARGDTYEGQFKNGFKHGKGTMSYRNGVSYYEGDWYYNKIEGKGTLVDDFGNKYEGEFKDNLKNGLGKCFYAANQMRFEGYWNNGIPEKGELFMKNGNHYEGEWRDDRFSGVGTIRYGNGDIYEGEWKEHMPHRYGKMLYRNGKIYNGEWFMGQKHGQGVMSYPNGDQYEGEWVQDLRSGFGMQKFQKGDIYEGEWFNDKMHGKGLLSHPDGSSYEGIWESGHKIEGQGVFQYANGNVAIRSNYNVNEKQVNIYNNVMNKNNFQGKAIEYRGSAMPMIQQQPQQFFRPKPLPLPMAGLQSLKSPNISQNKESLINNSGLNQSQAESNLIRTISQQRAGYPIVEQSVDKDQNSKDNPYKDSSRSKSVIRQSNIMSQNGNRSLNNSYVQGDKNLKGLTMIPTRPDLE
ncbi:UNKNOWN [Stylonychia lemnae]|uniref:MORN repeat-containing protein 3 n=1 Tax=Stylonychia lemnae TaxID=5949 RepID=A0A078AS04_STYLE|nr:UNKNOWN [Stylonychia lemnae]|eukprot:CDW84954.1 UNKNOWN [Stylonychia lemnae]